MKEGKKITILNCHVHPMMMPRNPLHCIVPGHILEEIALRGNQGQRERAITTLRQDSTIRSFRTARIENRARQRQIRRRRVATPVCEKRRFIYAAENRLKIPGTLVRREGDPPGADREVNEAYDGLGATYDLFCNEYNRNSINNRGMDLNA